MQVTFFFKLSAAKYLDIGSGDQSVEPLGRALNPCERGPWLSKVGTTILAPNDSPKGKGVRFV